MAYEWKNQVVLITGAASGIGAEVVKQILEEGVKYVAILDVDESAGLKLQDELKAKHGDVKFKFFKCDVANEEVFFDVFKTIKDEQGYIDIVINNAAIMNDRTYKKEIEINVIGLVSGTLKAIELMRKDKGGRGGTVINISSLAAFTHSSVLPVYNVTKSAVLQFSNCIGMDDYYSQTAVRVLALCFGATNTALLTAQKIGSFDQYLENKILETVSCFPSQTVQYAAKGIIDAYKHGKSGTTWLVDSGKPAQDISSDIQKGYDIMSSQMKPRENS